MKEGWEIQYENHKRATKRGVQRWLSSIPRCPDCRKVRLMPFYGPKEVRPGVWTKRSFRQRPRYCAKCQRRRDTVVDDDYRSRQKNQGADKKSADSNFPKTCK